MATGATAANVTYAHGYREQAITPRAQQIQFDVRVWWTGTESNLRRYGGVSVAGAISRNPERSEGPLATKTFSGKWWPGTESNRRRQPFQGCALPTELPGHFGWVTYVHLRWAG